jgi:kumamolisin
MANSSKMMPVSGSNRAPLPGAKLLRKTDPKKSITVSIYLRRNPSTAGEAASTIEKLSEQPLKERHYLSKPQLAAMFGADPQEMQAVKDWAKSCKLKVVDADAAKRRVKVSGTVAAINKAFGLQLNDYHHPDGYEYRGREGHVHVPEKLYGVVESVLGLDTRRVGRPRLRRAAGHKVARQKFAASKAGSPATGSVTSNPWPGTFFPPQVAALYDYPSNLTGKGQNVAIMSFNGAPDGNPHGGYRLAALKTYFTKVLGGTAPNFTNVTVMGPGNDPGPDTQASDQQGDSTGEVMLDACVVGSVAPGADIFMYFTEFTTQGWVDALQDAIAGDNNISVISISYGNPEDDPQGAWTPASVRTVNHAFQAAIVAGITICCAAGDDGSSDGVATGAHVDFPASSPYVLAVGGTKLTASSLSPPAIASEVVWNEVAQGEGAGGGGISVLFTKPAWQDDVNVPPSANPPHQVGRGVPDVAADADPVTGVVVMHIDGKHLEPIGGTSAAAPLWASLIARLNEGLNARCGFINPVLYAKLSHGVLNDITSGNNGAYAAEVGWDACTGLGTPNGTNLLDALSTGGGAAARKSARRGSRRASGNSLAKSPPQPASDASSAPAHATNPAAAPDPTPPTSR